MCTSADNAISR